MNSSAKHTAFIKKKAAELGFLFCGVSKAEFLEEEAPRLEKWLEENKHGSMGYMQNHFDKRLDPRLLVDGARSVVSLIYNYYPAATVASNLKISKYAYGEDYHDVIKDKLKLLLLEIQEDIGEVNGRAFVDSAPVMDKVWAKRSGLGWIGKNSNLLSKGVGSFFFIAELILDLELIEDGPVKDFCGTCTKCIDSCPTDAIVAPYVVDGSKCISYFTIELKEQLIPNNLQGSFDDWIFGCDICQDVCPWNRFSKPTLEQRFAPSKLMIDHAATDWKDITEETFSVLFRKSPIKRAKYTGFMRNISFVKGKS